MRWDSQYAMLQRLMEQKDSLSLSSAIVDKLTEKEWKTIEDILPILSLFYFYTNKSSKNKESISSSIPFINTLLTQLDNIGSIENKNIQEYKQQIKRYVNFRFLYKKEEYAPHHQNIVVYNLELRQNHTISTLFDPRYKATQFINEMIKNQAISDLQVEYIKFLEVIQIRYLQDLKIEKFQQDSYQLVPTESYKKIKGNDGEKIITQQQIQILQNQSTILNNIKEQFNQIKLKKTQLQNQKHNMKENIIQDGLMQLSYYYQDKIVSNDKYIILEKKITYLAIFNKIRPQIFKSTINIFKH
ncbi:hypothetical protein ABPG72_013327 [Tetrahymena utriculariae]